MRFKTVKSYFSIILILFIITSTAQAKLTTSQIAKKFSPSVVTIIALDKNDQPLSLGSGFFINDNGDIATNYHVLAGSAKAIVKTTSGDKGRILEIIKNDSALDLLVAKTTFKNTTPLPFGDSDTITVGEDIVAIGNPAGLEGTVSKGIISGIRKADGKKIIQITAPISPGSSGGPVLNLSGRVIGVATAYLDLGQNLNFCMPVNYLKNLKHSQLKLSSLPKRTEKFSTAGETKTLVAPVNINYKFGYYGSNEIRLNSIIFSLKNDCNYSIRNIMVFFAYSNRRAETISYSYELFRGPILPKLALQFTHEHTVKYWGHYHSIGGIESKGAVEIRILDYEIDRSSKISATDLLFKK